MFETVIPETVAKRSHRVLYESLPVSIAVHVIAIVGAVVGMSWNVAFPKQSPRLLRPYSLVAIPDPPPPPPPPAAPKAVPLQQAPAPQVTEVVAPTVIPDTIPVVHNFLPTPIHVEGAVAGGVEGGVAGGVVSGGSLNGESGGDKGGTVGGTLGGIVTDGRIHIERDKPLPLHPVSQVYPIYPEEGRLRHWEDSLVVRYVIGKDGRVREVIVVDHAERKIFEEAAVRALRNWRFRPMMKDGQPTEVVHELTIFFKLEST
jgi:protein TonB